MGSLDFLFRTKAGEQQFKAGDIVSPEKISAHLSQVCAKKARLQLTFDNDKFEYHSIFLEIRSTPTADYLLIDLPPRKEAARLTKKKQHATVAYRMGDTQFTFRTIFIDVKSEAEGGIILQMPSSISRFERRQNFRVEPSARQPITLHFKYGTEDLISVRAQVKDISAGGLAINTNRKDPLLAPGSLLSDVTFQLPSGDVVKTHGVVRYVIPNPEGATHKYKMGIQFIDLDRKQGEKIYKYVLKRQREQLKGK